MLFSISWREELPPPWPSTSVIDVGGIKMLSYKLQRDRRDLIQQGSIRAKGSIFGRATWMVSPVLMVVSTKCHSSSLGKKYLGEVSKKS